MNVWFFTMMVIAAFAGTLLGHWFMWLTGIFARIVHKTYLVLHSEFLGRGTYQIKRLDQDDPDGA